MTTFDPRSRAMRPVAVAIRRVDAPDDVNADINAALASRR